MELHISSGIKDYQLKSDTGEVTVSFNPTDEFFISQVVDTFQSLEEHQEEYREAIKASQSVKDSLAIMQKLNADMRERLNNLFGGEDIMTPLLGTVNVYAFADGMPIWANIMLAIMDQLEGEFAEQAKLSKKRIAKYTAKYESPDHKRKTKK